MCSLRTTLCLQHPPELIAAGAVFAALKLHRVKPGPSPSDPREWFQQAPVSADAAALEGAHRSPLPALLLGSLNRDFNSFLRGHLLQER